MACAQESALWQGVFSTVDPGGASSAAAEAGAPQDPPAIKPDDATFRLLFQSVDSDPELKEQLASKCGFNVCPSSIAVSKSAWSLRVPRLKVNADITRLAEYAGRAQEWLNSSAFFHFTEAVKHVETVVKPDAHQALVPRSFGDAALFALGASPDRQAAYLKSDLAKQVEVITMQDVADDPLLGAKLRDLVMAQPATPVHDTVLLGITEHKASSATSSDSMREDRADALKTVWNDHIARIQVFYNRLGYLILSGVSPHFGSQRGGERVVCVIEAAEAIRLVWKLDISAFTTQLWRFSSHMAIFDAKVSADKMRCTDFAEALGNLCTVYEAIWGAWVGTGTAKAILRWMEDYDRLSPSCATYDGGFMGLYEDIPIFVIGKLILGLKNAIRGAAKPSTWKDALSRTAVGTAWPALATQYLLRISFLELQAAKSSSRPRGTYSSPMQLNAAIFGMTAPQDSRVRDRGKGRQARACFTCGQDGHIARNCPDGEANEQKSRPSKKPRTGSAGVCHQYEKTGSCRYGASCRFEHVRGREPEVEKPRTLAVADRRKDAEVYVKKELSSAVQGIIKITDVLTPLAKKAGLPDFCLYTSCSSKQCQYHGDDERCSRVSRRTVKHGVQHQLTKEIVVKAMKHKDCKAVLNKDTGVRGLRLAFDKDPAFLKEIDRGE